MACLAQKCVAEGGSASLDLALLSVMQGCDYLPRLRGYSLGRAFDVLQAAKAKSALLAAGGLAANQGGLLISREPISGELVLNAPALCALLAAAFGGGAEEKEIDDYNGGGGVEPPSGASGPGAPAAETGVLGYCSLALWAVDQSPRHGSRATPDRRSRLLLAPPYCCPLQLRACSPPRCGLLCPLRDRLQLCSRRSVASSATRCESVWGRCKRY
mmetsp:Transcript_30068/g.68927  ORF Transcript_30068/g.68927 Transcript_30068/m.68927 type:complete len:215 (+) Transcript_30068:349-993(+)